MAPVERTSPLITTPYEQFTGLNVWVKAHQLTLALYKVTSTFPPAESYGLTSQIRRAATSIPASIAEGCGCGSNADLVRFLHIAMGSASELEYHLLLVHDLELVSSLDYEQLSTEVIEVKRMLTAQIHKLTADR